MSDPSYTQDQLAAGKIKLALIRLVGHYLYHAKVIEQFVIQSRPAVGTMAVTVRDGRIILWFNADFVLQTPADKLVGVLLHEVHHVALGHVTMDPKEFPDRWARIVAQEVTANEFVHEPLPGDSQITLELFPQLLPPSESTSQRYDRLVKVPENQRFPISSDVDLVVLVPGLGAGRQTLDDHGVWAEVTDRQAADEVLAEVLQQASWQAEVPDHLRDALEALGIGTEPGSGQYHVRGDAQGKLDWRQQMRRYVGQALEPSPSLNRPPRRFPDLIGIVPSRTYRPLRPKVLAVIDTSGSITDELLEEIAGELRRLARSHTVIVVECDTIIHKTYPFRGKLESILGRGGTDLRPPFESEFLRKHKPDVVISFTDGFGPAPERPPAVPTIWCLTAGGRQPASWGRAIRMRP
jgi:predicted metal-dependent peptidase